MAFDVTPSYIAGLLDADGSLTVARRQRRPDLAPTFSCKFTISWKKHPYSLAIFEEIASLYGGNICTITNKNLEYYSYNLTDKAMDKFLREVGPHIQLKKRQVKYMRILRALIGNRKFGRKKPPKVIKLSERLLKKIHSFNGYKT